MHLLTYASYCSHLHIGWHGACLVTEFAPTVRATSGQGGTPDGREQRRRTTEEQEDDPQHSQGECGAV